MTGVEVLPSVESVVAWAENLTPDELRKVAGLGMPENVARVHRSAIGADIHAWDDAWLRLWAVLARGSSKDAATTLGQLVATLTVAHRHGWCAEDMHPVLALLTAAGYQP